MKKFLNSKKFMHGGMSLLFLVIFIAVVIVINLVTETLTEQYALTQDITADSIYTISDTTSEMLNNLEEEVVVYLMMTEAQAEANSGFSNANELLKRMVGNSDGMFRVEYVDLTQNPSFRDNFTSPDSIVPGSIVMQSSKRDTVIDVNDLYSSSYDFSTGESYTSGYQADQKFASSLHYVTTDELPKIAFITGHGEYVDNESFNDIFSFNSYEISELELISEDIPEDIDFLVIFAPSTDYSEEEITKLNEYLTRTESNNLIVVSTPEFYTLERLNRYLSEWGVESGSNLVADPSRAVGSDPTTIVPELLSHEITDEIIASDSGNIITALTTELNVTYEADGYRTTSVLMQSSDSSYGKDASTGEAITDITQQSGDADGPFPLMVLSTDSQFISNVSTYHHVLFVSTYNTLSPDILSDDSFKNSSLITSAIGYMNPSVDAIEIEPIEFSSPYLDIVSETAIAILVVLVILIPLCFVGVGIFVYIRRKNR